MMPQKRIPPTVVFDVSLVKRVHARNKKTPSGGDVPIYYADLQTEYGSFTLPIDPRIDIPEGWSGRVQVQCDGLVEQKRDFRKKDGTFFTFSSFGFRMISICRWKPFEHVDTDFAGLDIAGFDSSVPSSGVSGLPTGADMGLPQKKHN